MNFIELFRHLEHGLGYHQFPVNEEATELSQIFDSSAAHHDFVVRLAHEIYKANHCQKLQSPVTRGKVEQVLSAIRVEILDGKKTDIDLYHFIEDVCFAVNDYFLQMENADQPRANKAS
ncbi:MAG: hypothetical protein ACWGOV_10980 [Acidiferrobacterales bacterium]